ncbi:tRNA glutamyl-Q(34) synthetase GluQRS [Citricoccus sp. SGAir0253]|uniref:tRNA glutamyl-Q(34) synthetase GluQRS n=1 Tax=Citricoccus sp. SGAir0253 TaxID=2567881 RepID=UPI0010CD0EEE|nr:tRNA glutamyl-Q(34) synthetase GluQRS [Citricoccus sp. SGAir0253]QCU79024.1 tRNA glutamyl-Q(34) synthetase GluQRS [Citricoccus sp. SGAir0253]
MPAGRYAPSPSGPLHLGNLRTAVLAWLFARHTGRGFLLRIEDLDRVRSGAEELQLADLRAIGLDWDGTPVRQSERLDRYERAVAALAADGLAYECFCSRKDIAEATSAPHPAGPPSGAPGVLLPPGAYPGTCRRLSEAERARRRRERPAALRIDAAAAAGLPDGTAPLHAITDVLHGEVTAAVDDFVLRRNDGAFAYNLAVVVDDVAQGVDQVVRGDDLLSSAPRQDWLARLLAPRTGAAVPGTEYVHVPLVLSPAGRRLAKRDGAVTLSDLAALPAGAPGVPDGGWTPARVRDLLLDSLGLPPGDLRHALAHFAPDTVPRTPWTPPHALTHPAEQAPERIRFPR